MPTPLEFEDRYHNLEVILDDFETTTVDVHRYRNNGSQYNANKYKEKNTVEAMKQEERLVSKMSAEIAKLRKAQFTKPKVEWKPRNQDVSLNLDTSFLSSPRIFTEVLVNHTITASTYSDVSRQARLFPGYLGSLALADVLQRMLKAMWYVHAGKGSPEEIAVALHLVDKYKLYDKKFLENPAQGVADYCERYIGLDCNGFVCNYAQAIGISSKKQDTSIEMYVPAGARRAKLEDIRPNDILAWTDSSHINIIDSVDAVATGPDGKQTLDCRVVESCGSNVSKETKAANGGLQNSIYTLRWLPLEKVFQVIDRPKGEGKNPKVYIAPLT
jgi:hypothetical protein